jgi:uncharacterized protein (TIGR00661 family)
MARIIYGVCSVGIGHAVRSSGIIKELEKKHEVLVLASNRAYHYLSNHVKRVHNIEGLQVFFKNNHVIYWKTLFGNLSKLNVNNYSKYLDLKKVADDFNPDFIVSDLETLTMHLAKSIDVPFIRLDNQLFLNHGLFKVPFRYWWTYFSLMFALKFMVLRADYSFVLKFPEQEVKEKKNVFGVNALVRKEIRDSIVKKGDHILVYDATRNHDRLMRMLKKINAKFRVYGYERVSQEGNVEFKGFNDEKEFIRDLASCRGLITNAGFGLLNEARYLGKPILCVPIKRHFEQILNALYIKSHKLGEFHTRLNERTVKKFLRRLNRYTSSKRKHETDLFERLGEVIKK